MLPCVRLFSLITCEAKTDFDETGTNITSQEIRTLSRFITLTWRHCDLHKHSTEFSVPS
jgi:hypothetical protein